MLIFDFNTIGNKLHTYRKKGGMTQSEVAEAAGLSDRTYAGIFTEENLPTAKRQYELIAELNCCRPEERETALQLLTIYLDSLKK